MPHQTHSNKKPTALNCEMLEAREVPATFGPGPGGQSIAVGDVIPGFTSYEYVIGSGPGEQALVRVFDSQGTLRYSFNPFGDYSGGVNVAVGDINADGQQEIVVSTAGGTMGRVRVYEFTGNQLRQLGLFVPFGPNYVGSVQIATGNATGDLAQEVVTGLSQNGSTVKVWRVDPTSPGTYFQIRQIRGFEVAYKGGVSLAVGNIDSQQNNPGVDPYDYDYDEIIMGKAEDEPRVRIVDVQLPQSNTRADYFVFDTNIQQFDSGLNLVAGSTDGQRGVEIYANLVGTTTVRVVNADVGVPIGEFDVPYPPTFGSILNMTINDNDDDVQDIYSVTDLFVVAGDGPRDQIPIIFPGAAGSPAGFNGSRAAP